MAIFNEKLADDIAMMRAADAYRGARAINSEPAPKVAVLDVSDDGTKVGFASSITPGWHTLGVTVADRHMTAAEAEEKANLGWTMTQRPLTVTWDELDGIDATGREITKKITLEVPGKVANTRFNPFNGEAEILGVGGSKVIQLSNRELLEWGMEIAGLAEGSEGIASAGSWDGGRKVFASVVIPEATVRIGGTDEIKTYVGLLDFHDYTGSLTAILTDERLECRNTTVTAIDGGIINGRRIEPAQSRIRLPHTANLRERMKESQRVLGLVVKRAEQLQIIGDGLLETEINDVLFFDMIEAAFSRRPDATDDSTKGAVKKWDSRFSTLLGARTNPVNVVGETGNAWNALNAVTWYENFATNAAGDTSQEQAAARSEAIVMGRTDGVVKRAMEFAMAVRN